ncbi:MAG: diacylglycerol kinase family protein [Anaerolineae bacterium]
MGVLHSGRGGNNRANLVYNGSVRARLIYNPSAGMHNNEATLRTAVDVLTGAGWEAEVRETRAGGDGQRLAREAAAQGYDVAFALGGDGTVNDVLNGLVDTQTALGVLPYGTVNVWAKEMGLPLGDMAAAARLHLQARVRRIDVGLVEGNSFGTRAFGMWCGVGFDAAIAAEIEPQRAARRRLGALIWWLAGIRTAFTFRGRMARIRVDGQNHRMRVLLGLASNVQLYGGLVRISPQAQVDDGLLDLALFRGTGAWPTAWHLIRVFLGWHIHAPDVEHYRAREIVITSNKLPVHVDAEPVGHTPVRITIRPQALNVLVPPTANQSLFAPSP